MTAEKNMRLIPFQKNELDLAYDLYKKELVQIVDEAFGWDEKFQRNRFRQNYDLNWFHWVEVSGQRIGYICFHRRTSEFHINLLIVLDGFKRKGFGSKTMAVIHAMAAQKGLNVTLSSFKNNKLAVTFYAALGYYIYGEDDWFVDMRLDNP